MKIATFRLGSISWPGELLDRKHIYAGCGILLAIEIAIFLFTIAGTYGLIVPLDKPTTTDFVSFYAAGSLAETGSPQLAYDNAEHLAAEERVTKTGIEYNFFYYPPTFLLICAGLARLPYLAAFLVFETGTLCFYLLAARRILGEPGRIGFVLLLAFPPVLWTIGLGQNSLLTAALFATATLLVDRRPAIAGVFFGALCYKPHLALLVPVALVAGRRWPAFLTAFLSGSALCLLSLGLFGWQTWLNYISALAKSDAVYASGRISFTGYINLFGAVRQLGGSEDLGYAVQAGAILAAAALVAYVWRRNLPLQLRAATLASAALIAAPFALFYELMLGAVATLWLLHGDAKNHLAEWGKITLAALFLLSLSPRSLAEFSHMPIGPLIALTLAVLVAAEALRWEVIHARGFARGEPQLSPGGP
jgi:alpha-1,2-mannosyltransferase